MAQKTIYRTVIEVEVLSDKPTGGSLTIEEIAEGITTGSWSGLLTETKVDQPFSGRQAVQLIKAQGSDSKFFRMDDQGNELDEDEEP